MISKHIECKVENDNYSRLANYAQDSIKKLAEYISDQDHQGEKVLYSWFDGCAADDYDLAIKEVEATQAMNTRTTKEKTYHLVVSFHPEDEPKLNEQVFREIEKEFALTLGFAEHQRHIGIHKNTNNIHMHIAYNMINPKTYDRHEPYQDFKLRLELHKRLEQKYDLQNDNEQVNEKANQKAKDFEAHSKEESFITYLQNSALSQKIHAASNWQEVHQACAEYGIEYILRGAGAVFKNKYEKHACKASELEFSKKTLEDKLGIYTPKEEIKVQEISRYTKKPLYNEIENPLYIEFTERLAKKKQNIQEIEVNFKLNKEKLFQKKQENITVINNSEDLAKKDKYRILKELNQELAQKLALLKRDRQQKYALQEPFSNWGNFLKYKAEHERSNEAVKLLQKQKKEYSEYKEKNLKENPLRKEFAERMNKQTNKQYKILEAYESKLEVILQKKQEALDKAKSSRILRNKDKYKLINNINNTYAQDILAHNIAKQKELEAIKEPFSTWQNFLKYKSEQGDELATLMLKDKEIKGSPEEIAEQKLQKEFYERRNQKTEKRSEILTNYAEKNSLILQKKQKELKKLTSDKILLQNDKKKLITKLNIKIEQELLALNKAKDAELKAIEEPFSNWANFLKYKSEQGDKSAEDLLQKIDKKFPEYQEAKPKDYTHQEQALEDRQKIEESKILKPQEKKELLSVARMKHLCRLNPEIQVKKHWLDLKGITYFQLRSGGTVRDAGQAIYFSSFDPKAKEAAEQLASLKFGKKLELIENKFLPKKIEQEQEKTKELSR